MNTVGFSAAAFNVAAVGLGFPIGIFSRTEFAVFEGVSLGGGFYLHHARRLYKYLDSVGKSLGDADRNEVGTSTQGVAAALTYRMKGGDWLARIPKRYDFVRTLPEPLINDLELQSGGRQIAPEVLLRTTRRANEVGAFCPDGAPVTREAWVKILAAEIGEAR